MATAAECPAMNSPFCERSIPRHDKMRTGPANAGYGELLRALSENRDLYQLQSKMTQGGKVPTMEQVREQFDRIFADG